VVHAGKEEEEALLSEHSLYWAWSFETQTSGMTGAHFHAKAKG